MGPRLSLAFSFSSSERALLKRDLPPAVIEELARALQVGHRTAMFTFPGERRLLARIEALLQEADSQGQTLPPDMRRWLEVRAAVARGNVQTERNQRRRGSGAPAKGFRPVVESLTLRVLTRHGIPTRGQKAARVLAIALRARLGIPTGSPEAQKQALVRANHRLREYDPVADKGPRNSDMCEWAGEAYRPRTGTRRGPATNARG